MFNGSSSIQQPHPAVRAAGDEESALSAPDAFVCVSAGLRRLLLQGSIAAPRMVFATLEGEAGTGKHLFAQNLHHQSPTLATLPFRRRDARAWLASDADTSALCGTLYLDRVDLLAEGGQGLLLNLIKSLQNEAAPAPRFLLLASSHTSIRHLASQGQFLPDLAFRLSAVRFPLPPLRDHREDITPIAQALIDRICRRYLQPTAVLGQGTIPRLLQHNWPGNVRELASQLESAVLESTTGILRPSDFHLESQPPGFAETAAGPSSMEPAEDLSLDAVIRRHIQAVLELNRGNKLRAARQLGISRSTLYRLLAGETTLAS